MELLLTKYKKSVIAFTIFAVLILAGVGIGIYLHAPSNVLAFDINPSIEIHTNRLGQVVSVDPINEDGIKLLAGYQLTDNNLEDVIKDIANRLMLNGYLTSDKTNEILLSSDSGSDLINRANSAITNYLGEKNLKVDVLEQTLNNKKGIREAAHQYHISVGKMAIINKLMATSNQLTVDELSKVSIKTLMGYFSAQNISREELAKKYAVVVSTQSDLADPQVTVTPDTQATTTPEAQVTQVADSEPSSQNGADITATPALTENDSDNEDMDKENSQKADTETQNKQHVKKHWNRSDVKTEDSKVESDNENDSDKNDVEEKDDDQNDNKNHSKVRHNEDQEETNDSEYSDDEDSDYKNSDYNENTQYENDDSDNNRNTYEDNKDEDSNSKDSEHSGNWSGWGHEGEDD